MNNPSFRISDAPEDLYDRPKSHLNSVEEPGQAECRPDGSLNRIKSTGWVNIFAFINAISDTVLDMIITASHVKPSIFLGQRFGKAVSYHWAMGNVVLHLIIALVWSKRCDKTLNPGANRANILANIAANNCLPTCLVRFAMSRQDVDTTFPIFVSN